MPKNLKTSDILNTVYGTLSIIEDLGVTKGVRFVITRCICGKEKKQRLGDLRKKTRTVKCECLPKDNSSRGFKSVDFVPLGSRLTFLRLTDRKEGSGTAAIYKCVCGIEKEIRASHVRLGKVRSCGCLKKGRKLSQSQKLSMSSRNITHNLSKHPLYKIYFGIIKRCENEKCKAYPYYGGEGVVMCQEWRNDFKLFYNWAVSNGWRKGLHIDKDIIPKKLGIPALVYSPELCSIVTTKENMNAIITNVNIEYMGRTQTLSQWATEFNVNYKRLWSRLKLGWTFDRALSKDNTTTKETGIMRRKIILNQETGIFYFGVEEAAGAIGQNTNVLSHKLSGLRKNNTPLKYV